jgi:putative FmdB family regulatory protein
MPLYEYKCDACGATFELIRKFSDPPADTCQKCGQGPVQKLLSSPAFHLKGSGWYATDYARKGGETGASKAEGESSSEKPAASKDTDSKPATDKPAAPAGAKDT